MTQIPSNTPPPLPRWHRNLLASAALFTVLLIAMGGVLCATHSIRTCPDWPGCFGKAIPPLETSPILEMTHRTLAALSSLLILIAAVAGLARKPRLGWVWLPPLAAIPLLLAVSFFGATVVLHGLAPGWAAVDLGSALLIAALMMAAAVIARNRGNQPELPNRLAFRSLFARTVLGSYALSYVVLVSGVLVSGPDSLTACLGWPIYSLSQFRLDNHPLGDAMRLAASLVGLVMIITLLVMVRRYQKQNPAIFRSMQLVGEVFLLELLLQQLLHEFEFQVYLRVGYTVTAAVFWGLLTALVTMVGLHEAEEDAGLMRALNQVAQMNE